ncbi:MAG: c-type cytochrome [Pseudolabrys sp.]
MWQKLPAFIREWLILIVAILVIVPLLYFSSYDASSSKSITNAPSLNRRGESAGQPTAANAPAPSAEQSIRPAPTSAKATPNSAQAPAKAQSHDRVAAAPSVQTSGQGTPAPTAAIAPVIGDVATGKLVFRKCQACHSLEPGKNGLGPSLAGLIGKKASGVPNYNYSPAMKGSSLTWDVATLDAYLSDPQRLVPGNKMPFPGLKTENERNAVIAFLASTSVPGPEAPAAAAARVKLRSRPTIHVAHRDCRRPHGLYWRRRCDRRPG